MIKLNDKTISSVYSGTKIIEKIYKGTLLVYEGWKNLITSGVPPLKLLNCKGVDLVDYKLYGNSVQDGTPTPDTPIEVESVGEYDEATGKYKIPVKASGKNLYQESSFETIEGITVEYNPITHIYTINGTSTKAGNIWLSNKFIPDIKEGQDVALTSEIVSGTIDRNGQYVYYSMFNNKNDKYIRNQNVLLVKKGKVTANAKMISGDYMHYCIQVGGEGVTFNNVQLRVQLEKGTKSTSYEPYIEPAPLTNIYLNEPLRKVGDYADYIDFENKKVVRKIAHYNIDRTEEITVELYGTNSYSMNLEDIKMEISSKMVLSNNFKGKSYNERASGETNIIYIYYGSVSRVYFRNTDFETLDIFKTKLVEKQTYLNYVLETPKEENIELPSIPTIKGTTILEVDTTTQPSNLEVVYKGK